MKVRDLIRMLKKYPQDADIRVTKGEGDGCDTCGYGETQCEHNIRVIDLETRVVLEPCLDYVGTLSKDDEKKVREARSQQDGS